MNKTVISLAAATVISAGAAASAEASELYTVKQGDTLFSIANQYKISVVQLMGLNDLTSDALSIDDQLIISENDESAQVEPAQMEQGEEVSEYAIVSAASSSYTVKSGDSLGLIASHYKMSVAS
ncbi:LysM peptidoglycan-binding domain-containing protein, partial [Domibacillus iocasae]|uniref:LysM peptidoglycan-binding domain-containing protein n=1 Tax=Domibacillus iocasae TaxID=1714016 RepID=UPI00114D1A9F